MKRPKAHILRSLLALALLALVPTARGLRAQEPKAISSNAIDGAVLAALAHQGVTMPKVFSHLDLTAPFQTSTQWTFVAVQDESQPQDEFEEHGLLYLCLVHFAKAECDKHLLHQTGTGTASLDDPYELFSDRVVYRDATHSNPLLFLSACGPHGANGNCTIASALYAYDKTSDQFVRVFLNFTGKNNNQATRFIESGPLRGDVIVNTPTDNAPYTYWIEVYRANNSGQYSQILRYRGSTHYGDGNPLAVIDSEMPGILRRFGLWHPGDPLPVPPHLPKGCKALSMRNGEEWCK